MFKTTTIILLIHLQTSQPQFLRDFITFTAHLRCNLTGNNFFRYRIQYFEEDVLLADDVLTRLDNVGSSTDGLAIDNNFAVTHGDGFLDNFYEMYALILHNCTSNKRKMRQIRHYFEPCSTQKGSCKNVFDLDITNKGEEVPQREIGGIGYQIEEIFKSEHNPTQ